MNGDIPLNQILTKGGQKRDFSRDMAYVIEVFKSIFDKKTIRLDKVRKDEMYDAMFDEADGVIDAEDLLRQANAAVSFGNVQDLEELMRTKMMKHVSCWQQLRLGFALRRLRMSRHLFSWLPSVIVLLVLTLHYRNSVTPCPLIENAYQISKKACQCADGFSGNITWSEKDSLFSGMCLPAKCDVDVRTNGHDGLKCGCGQGLLGNITWNLDVPTAACDPAPCPARAYLVDSGSPSQHCVCETGSLSWDFTTQAWDHDCECWDANRQEWSHDCACSSWQQWDSSTQQCVGGTCHGEGMEGHGESCKCGTGYAGELNWNLGLLEGQCTLVESRCTGSFCTLKDDQWVCAYPDCTDDCQCAPEWIFAGNPDDNKYGCRRTTDDVCDKTGWFSNSCRC